MNEEAKDYAPETDEDTEEAILTRFERLKQWWAIGGILVAVLKYGWLAFKWIFYGGMTAMAVGEVTDTKPLRTVGIETGMIQEQVPRGTHDHDAILDELMNLQEDVAALEEQLDGHQHNYPAPGPGLTGQPGPAGPPGKDGEDGLDGKDGRDGIDGKVVEGTASPAAINNAFEKHIKFEH